MRPGVRERGGGGAQAHVAARAILVSAVYRGVSGPDQRGVCGSPDAATTRVHRRRLWAWRRNVFCRVLLFSGAEQPGAAASGGAAVDRVADDGLGSDFGVDGVCQRPAQLLRAALSAGGGGGGILPRRNPLSEELVSCTGAVADGGPIHDGGAVVGTRGRTIIGCAAGAASDSQPDGMAMDVSA